MDPHEILTRHGEHPERIRLAKVVFDQERQPSEVVERRDIVGMHASGVKRPGVVGDVGVRVAKRGLQPLGLQGPEFVERRRLDGFVAGHVRSWVDQTSKSTETVPLAGVA